jgi:hypothetical protein
MTKPMSTVKRNGREKEDHYEIAGKERKKIGLRSL